MPSNIRTLTSGYHPAPGTTPYTFSVTVTSTARSLGFLLNATGSHAVPLVADIGEPQSGAVSTANRYPRHVVFQVPAAAANPVYMTWDGTTAPVVATPIGFEIAAGTGYKFENSANLLSDAGAVAQAPNTSFQFIATSETVMTVIFSD